MQQFGCFRSYCSSREITTLSDDFGCGYAHGNYARRARRTGCSGSYGRERWGTGGNLPAIHRIEQRICLVCGFCFFLLWSGGFVRTAEPLEPCLVSERENLLPG